VKEITMVILFVTSIGIANASCESGSDSSIAQYGITWIFDQEYTCGRFVNGDFWVIGPVTINDITPALISVVQTTQDPCTHPVHCIDSPSPYLDRYQYTNHCISVQCVYAVGANGWEINPSHDDHRPFNGEQGFDGRIPDYNPGFIPTLPHLAGPGESIVKAVSNLDGPCESTENSWDCLDTSAILTVLDQVPPDNGAGTFRPPYVGTEKPLYSVDDMKIGILPNYPRIEEAPSLAWIEERFRRVQMNHEKGYTGRSISPIENFQNPARYGPNIGIENAEAALGLMFDDPIEDKMPALVNYVQTGIDWLFAVKQGKSWTVQGPGIQPGFHVPVVFAAALLDDEYLKDIASNAIFPENRYLQPHVNSGRAIYGDERPWYTEKGYWEYIIQIDTVGTSSSAQRDPYGYIDGEIPRISGYSSNGFPGPWKGSALVAHLIPELKPVWNNNLFLDYMDRRINIGKWTQPDPCAPHDGDIGNYGTTFGPDGFGGCILDTDTINGIGRYPELHGIDPDAGSTGGYSSVFINAMWDAYRGPSCYDSTCEEGETCEYDCGISRCAHDAENAPCDGCIDATELIDYLNDWKLGDVQLDSLMEAIGIWKDC